MKRLPIAVLTGLLVTASLEQARAAEPARPAEATLTVDTSEIGDAGPILRRRLLERGGQVFRDGNVMPDESGAGVEVLVYVREVRGEDPSFTFDVSIQDSSRPSAGTRWTVQCPLCTETELIESVAAELAKVASTLTALAVREPKPEPAPVVEPVARDAPPQTVHGPPASDEPRGLHVLTSVGVGTVVAGAVAVGIGAVLVVMPPRVLPDDPLQERFTQPPGYGLLAGGGAALIAGTVMIVVGVKRSRAGGRVALTPGGVRVRF